MRFRNIASRSPRSSSPRLVSTQPAWFGTTTSTRNRTAANVPSAHCHPAEAIRRCVAFGVRSVEHGTFIDEPTASFAAGNGAFIVPTMAVIFSLRAMMPKLGLSAAIQEKLDHTYKQALSGMDIMRKAGVKVCLGTDLLGEGYVEQCREFAIRREVFSPLEILRQATSTGAALLLHEDKLGCIKPGAFADLLVVDGDPLQDIGLLADDGRKLALIMRDVQTRFFGTALGFVVAIAWPITHIFVLILINSAAGRATPYGDNAALFFATGALPFMCFNYMSRFTMLGVTLNKPLLNYPIVKVGDILIARAVLEVLNAAVVVVVTIIILTIMGVDVWPPRPQEAMYALLACMLLGFGFGIVNGVIGGIFPFWITPFSLFQIVLWMASGVIIVPDELPESFRYWLSWNPALVSIWRYSGKV